MTVPTQSIADDEIDTELAERYYGGQKEIEEKVIGDIIEVIQEFIDRRFREGRRPALRDAHARDTGCVRASFAVDSDLDPGLAQGVFVAGKVYEAWIRFSNGNSEQLSERAPDARGMAIKLLGISGPKLGDEISTQDFLLANNPVFFIDDLKRYHDTLVTFHSGGLARQYLALSKLKPVEALLAVRVNATLIANPLYSRYWSMTPYRLGTDPGRKCAIKFMVKPRIRAGSRPPSLLGSIATPGFSLKNELAKVLAGGEARFDFYIQRYVDQRTPVEESTIEWTETVAKPEHVATVTIPAQTVLSAERDRFVENLSFNPWHCLPEHKPLGVVNRARKRIYLQASELRHGLNNSPMLEPKAAEG